MKKKIIVFILCLIILIISRVVYDLRHRQPQPKTYSSNGVTVTIDRTEFKQNEEIFLHITPPTGYWALLRYGDAENMATSVSLPEGVQKLRTYSYGPGLADVEIWKNEDGAIRFFKINERGERTPNQPAVKFQIKITQ